MNKKEFNFPSPTTNWNWNNIVKLCKKIDETYKWGISENLIGKNSPGKVLDEDIEKVIPETFCIIPFSRLQIDPDGRAKPCCKYKTGIAPDLTDPNYLPNKNIDELWNQPEFTGLRDKFMKGEKPDGCKVCWDEEAAGVKSLRQIVENGAKKNSRYNIFVKLPSQSPSHLDLKLSNLCNLKCRICNPFLSSQWIKEYKDLKIGDDNVIKIYTENSKEKFFEKNINEDILKKWSKEITDIEFYGGEPLLQQEHKKILEIATKNGNPSQLRLFYNTNSTQFNEEFFDYWKLCEFVTINFSVDDIGNRFEYQRKNASFQDVFKNLELFKKFAIKYNVKHEFNIYCTIGILNVLYLPEFLKEFEQFDFPIWLNLVHYPDHFNIKNLPKKVKELIKEKYSVIDYTKIKFNKDSMSVQDVLNFMMYNDDNPDMIFKFHNTITMHDDYRKESFCSVFPELDLLLKNYEN